MAVMFFFVNLALFFNNYVNPVALDKISWKYYIVFCVWLSIELTFVWFFFIETRYTPLEEIAKYFDGEDARVGGDAGPQSAKEKLSEMEGVDTLEVVSKVESSRGMSKA